MQDSRPQIVDLFAGVGGFSLGATRAGFQLALAVELDKHAMAAHRLNFPKSRHLMEDISALSSTKLMQSAELATGELDGLVGGPPCQGFSVMGKRNALDPRNNLFIKFFELVEQCRPKFFVAENVLGILDEPYAEIRKKAIGFVGNEYVILEPMKLKASDFGAPTSRERAFFIGYRADAVRALSCSDFDSLKIDTPTTVADALRGLPLQVSDDWLTEENSWRSVEALPDSPFWNNITGQIPDSVGDAVAIKRLQEDKLVSGCFGTRHSVEVRTRYEQLGPGEKDRVSKATRLKLDGLCPTLRAGTDSDHGSYQAVRPIHPTLPRVITPREAARLQGFPDWYRFAPSKWHSFRQIGNSVSPILAEAVFKVIHAHLISNA
jgi:DNA (cytosine-5)-methyltransferase 1